MTSRVTTPPRGVRGFTLLELLTVVAIMGVIMVIAVAGFIDIGRGAGIKSTVLNVRASVSSARQHAITKRVWTYFVYGNTNLASRQTGYYFFATNATPAATNYSLIGTTNYTADGILFNTTNSVPLIIFDTDGSCVNDGAWITNGNKRSIELYEALRDGTRRPRGLATTTQVYRLTGRLKGGGWVNE